MLDEIKTIVTEAGEMLKEGFYGTKAVRYKGSKDLVTEYDVRIEEFLIQRLEARFPDFGVVAEEGDYASQKADRFIIDPIDGTTNFVHGIPHVAISLGVHRASQPYLGIVYNPILGEFYHAIKGEGAYLNGTAIRVSEAAGFKNSLIATGFPYTSDKSRDDFEWVISAISNVLPNVQDIRRLGAASLDLCYVARGSFEGYYEMNLKPWDVAAGTIILEEAGGRVSNHNGDAYDIFDDRIIVATNGRMHTDLLDSLP